MKFLKNHGEPSYLVTVMMIQSKKGAKEAKERRFHTFPEGPKGPANQHPQRKQFSLFLASPSPPGRASHFTKINMRYFWHWLGACESAPANK
jgi:hypothetical protein